MSEQIQFSTLPLLPLKNSVLFPGLLMHFPGRFRYLVEGQSETAIQQTGRDTRKASSSPPRRHRSCVFRA